LSYVELRAKLNFSFLTGASHPGELVAAAISQGYQLAKDRSGFKFLVDTEFVFVDHSNITVVA
jgi:hypothetical protein